VRGEHGRCVWKAILVRAAEGRDVFRRQNVQPSLQRLRGSDECHRAALPAVIKKALDGNGNMSACAAANGAFELAKTRDCHRSGRLLPDPDEPHGAGGDTLDGMQLPRDFLDIQTGGKIFRHRA
jgi:hypothetical protein